MDLPDFMLGNSLIGAAVTAWGWSLVHFLWQGCVIAALYWLVCVLSRRDSAQLRYWAGVLSLMLSLAALVITFSVYYKPAAEFAASLPQGEPVNAFLVLSGALPDSWALLQEGLQPAFPLLVIAWLLGVLLHAGRTACGWVGIRRLVQGADPDAGPEVAAMVQRLLQVLDIPRTVRVMKSGLVRVPLAVGWFKPVILLPASVLLNLPREQLEMVVAHELGHIKRHDFVFNLLQIILETLLFYHPAIGWISRRVREERENCCDDLVVARCRKPATYARALANLELIRSPVAAAALTATGGNLILRIKRIIDKELPRSSSGYAQIALLSAIALIVALGTHQGMLMSRALNQVAGSVSLAPSDVAWKTWGESRETWAVGVMQYARMEQRDTRPRVAASGSERAPAAVTPVNHADTVVVPAKRLLDPVSARPFLADLPPADRADRPDPVNSPRHVQPFEPKQTALLVPPATLPSRAEVGLSQPAIVRPVFTSQPRYPWWARAKGVEGFVELAFSVDHQGKATHITVVDSIPSGAFDRAAQKALKKWQFERPAPGTAGSRLTQVFNFKLENTSVPRRMSRDCRTTGHRVCSQLPNGAIIVYVNPPIPKESAAKIN